MKKSSHLTVLDSVMELLIFRFRRGLKPPAQGENPLKRVGFSRL